MIPTLRGRIQTRIFAVVVLGGIWTAIITPFLPGIPDGAATSDLYKMTYSILATVLVLGIVWELVYHGLMQWRWEKDWPTQFGLLTVINEGLVLWLVLRAGLVPNADPAPPGSTWLTHFLTTWVVIFLFLNGPMKVFFVKWRLQGGRLVGP